MKIAMYYDGHDKQIVLTPENDDEREFVDAICPRTTYGFRGTADFHRGGFYACQGGWVRESEHKESLIFVVRKPETIPEPLVVTPQAAAALRVKGVVE